MSGREQELAPTTMCEMRVAFLFPPLVTNILMITFKEGKQFSCELIIFCSCKRRWTSVSSTDEVSGDISASCLGLVLNVTVTLPRSCDKVIHHEAP